jgi:hypothetical protein
MTNGTRTGWGVSVTSRPLSTPGKDTAPIVQEAWWAPGPVWRGAEYLAPTGIRSPDRPVLNQPIYRLSYQAHFVQSSMMLTVLSLHPLCDVTVSFSWNFATRGFEKAVTWAKAELDKISLAFLPSCYLFSFPSYFHSAILSHIIFSLFLSFSYFSFSN